MSYITPIGNRVIWTELERVELEDMTNMGDLPLRALSQALGVLRGPAGQHNAQFATATGQNGLMSRLVYNGADATNVTFQSFQIGFSAEGTGPDDEGLVQWFQLCNYDLTTSFQVGRSTAFLDFTGYSGLNPFVWARRVQIEADPETRRGWNEVSEAEEPILPKTRTREYVVLGLSNVANANQPPTGDPGWVKIARATSVTVPGSVVLAPRYGLSKFDPVYEATTASVTNGAPAKYWDTDRVTDGPGLADMITAIFAALSKIRDGRWQFDPNKFTLADASVAGLKGWADQIDDPSAVGITQLNTLTILPDNIDRMLKGRDKLPRYLGSINCSAAGVFTYDNSMVQMAATGPFTQGGTVGPWYLITITTPIMTIPGTYVSDPADVVSPYSYASVKIYSYTFTPFHDGTVWDADGTWDDVSAGRTVDSAPNSPLPHTISGTGTLKIKVRFRQGSDADAILPAKGWCFTLFGAPEL